MSHFLHYSEGVLTDALATKSVTWMSSPECASTKASNQVPVFTFWICMTWAKASERSFFATNSMVGGCSLNFPERADSALAMASSTEIEGVVGGTLAAASLCQKKNM